MKNIHVIATDKPSRLRIGNNGNFVIGLAQNAIVSKNDSFTNQNIYITSDEEIKEGVNQWYLDKFLNKPRNSSGSQYGEKQDVIILTTDQDLIKDGVQAIDDEFLEWFVQNPSCENVKVELIEEIPSGFTFGMFGNDEPPTELVYKIIIPIEEPKQEPCDNCNNDVCCCIIRTQETLEEAISRIKLENEHYIDEVAFELGAKWNQERSYSEEDVKQFAFECVANFLSNDDNKVEIKLVDVIIDRLNNKFEQFKNK